MRKNPILINLLPVKQGGGVQNTMSFLNLLINEREAYHLDKFVFFVNINSELHSFCETNGLNYICVSKGIISRLFFELTVAFKFPKNSICFTFFGPPLIGSYKYFYNINGFAYSNILHKDIDFWSWGSRIFKIKKALKDWYREYSYFFADEIIFETELLIDKAQQHRLYKKKKLHLIKMSPSTLVSQNKVIEPKKHLFLNAFPNKSKKILCLSGAHPNKRLHLIPDILDNFKEETNIVFILTLDPSSDYLKQILARAKSLGVDNYIINVGPVSSKNVASLISTVDFMANFAVLESFSNNFVEAWIMEKPLIVTDSEWARRACNKAALYVNLNDIRSVSSKIHLLSTNDKARLELIKNGKKLLESVPTQKNRFDSYMKLIWRKK